MVYLSGVDADVASPFCYAFTNGRTEQLLMESGRHHALTGPEAHTFEGLASVLTGIAGIPVSCTDVPARVLVEELTRSGEDPGWTYAYATMLASVREGRWGTVSGEVLRLTGRAPSSVVDVLGPTA